MAKKELIERRSIIETSAIFSESEMDRYLLRMSWDDSKKSAVIIMASPSSADEYILDQTTMLCRNGAIKSDFGSIAIVNLTSSIGAENPKSDKQNCSVIIKECEAADCILCCWGRGTNLINEKESMLNALETYKDKLYTLVDSKGLEFSHPLSPYAHEWKIKKLDHRKT